MPEDWQEGGFGLYIHWPFCEAKCPYCDFNSHVSRNIDQDAWCAAYLEELDRAADLTPDRVLQSVFFGGGTPSLMRPQVVARILERVAALWTLSNNIEITLEANPSSVETGKFSELATAGVNRVSLGVQALNDPDLKRLGRLHSASEAKEAIDTALQNFSRVSFDLIYGRQDQSLASWVDELNVALTWGVSHISLYNLTIEEGTAFGDRYAAGKLGGLPDNDLCADMYDATQNICENVGLPAYEVSNHAKAGEESRHNLIYWRYGDYVGIGPGAHGRLTVDGQKIATEQTSSPGLWLAGSRDLVRRVLSANDQGQEMLLMGLRLNEGVNLRRFERLSGTSLSQNTLSSLQQEGWLTLNNGTMRATPSGRLLLNSLLVRLLQ